MYLHPFLPVLKVELKFKIVVSLSRKPRDWNYIVVQTPSKTNRSSEGNRESGYLLNKYLEQVSQDCFTTNQNLHVKTPLGK